MPQPDTIGVRAQMDYRIYEEEIEGLVELTWNSAISEYECEHLKEEAQGTGRYEKGYIKLKEPDPKLGEQSRQFAMCRSCYQKLRRAGVARKKGLWESAEQENTVLCSAPWSFVEHTWAESTVYDSNDLAVCSFSIREGATEETQAVLEARMNAQVRLVTAAPLMLEAINHVLDHPVTFVDNTVAAMLENARNAATGQNA